MTEYKDFEVKRVTIGWNKEITGRDTEVLECSYFDIDEHGYLWLSLVPDGLMHVMLDSVDYFVIHEN
jgi:hypothetical protein